MRAALGLVGAADERRLPAAGLRRVEGAEGGHGDGVAARAVGEVRHARRVAAHVEAQRALHLAVRRLAHACAGGEVRGEERTGAAPRCATPTPGRAARIASRAAAKNEAHEDKVSPVGGKKWVAMVRNGIDRNDEWGGGCEDGVGIPGTSNSCPVRESMTVSWKAPAGKMDRKDDWIA